MNPRMLLPACALLLAACAPTMGSSSYSFARQDSAPVGMDPTGTATVRQEGGSTSAFLQLSGLAALTNYVAHFHSMGTASTAPCASGGPAIMASKMTGMSDALGNLTLSGSVADSVIRSATYLNVHTAKDQAGTPADAGVACTAVTLVKK
ncbi:CHRD domain-containing protein [Deinococcus sp.]|uniref:CHRD domain-containing protein n=1 Tax=Deinococcus sp. TaxID=47478 RepID=UPI003CC67F13